jgi:hypothetical protein
MKFINNPFSFTVLVLACLFGGIHFLAGCADQMEDKLDVVYFDEITPVGSSDRTTILPDSMFTRLWGEREEDGKTRGYVEFDFEGESAEIWAVVRIDTVGHHPDFYTHDPVISMVESGRRPERVLYNRWKTLYLGVVVFPQTVRLQVDHLESYGRKGEPGHYDKNLDLREIKIIHRR